MFGIKNKKAKTVNSKSMTLEKVTRHLNKLRLPLSLVFTPVNLASEKKKFLEASTCNPQFKYEIVKNSNNEIIESIKDVGEISDVDPRISDFYVELIRDKIQTHELMTAVGDNKRFTEIAIDKFGMPSYKLFRNACIAIRTHGRSYNLANSEKVKNEEYLGFKEIKDVFEKSFQAFGLDDWKLAKSKKIRSNGVKMGLKKKSVFVDPNIRKRPSDLKKTIVHEIGTHVFRHLNGLETGYHALSKPNVNTYLNIEEGLAMYNEEMMGYLRFSHLRERALLVWLIQIGQTMSFRDLYNALSVALPPKTSFNLVLRVKRGLGDTSKPGIYPRDYAYFRGFRRVRRMMERKPYMYELLYAGKIDFKQTKWVEEGLIKKPKYVPSKEAFRKVFKQIGG
ncbi:DUF1704 domain-containing protein [Candidatus Dojkabacteria bacterium]|nr:DUF1704 domain-containing protein [Candidatus Dojkabacteria bacterium]